MKKIYKLLLAGALLMSLTGCSSQTDSQKEASSKEIESELSEGVEVALKNLTVSAEEIEVDFECEEGKSIRIQNIRDGKIIYTVEEANSSGGWSITESIHSVSILANEHKKLADVESGYHVESCILYLDQPLYSMMNVSDYYKKLMYGNETLLVPEARDVEFQFLDLDSLYVILNTAVNNYNSWIQQFYTFDGQLNDYNRVEGAIASFTNLNDLFVTYYRDDLMKVYVQENSSLVERTFYNDSGSDEQVCMIGDYLIDGNQILSKNNEMISEEYEVVYLKDGNRSNGDAIFLNNDHRTLTNAIVDIGNNMFLYTDVMTKKLYKGMIDEENKCILLMDAGVDAGFNCNFKIDENSFYGYYDVFLHNGNRKGYDQSNQHIYKITWQF